METNRETHIGHKKTYKQGGDDTHTKIKWIWRKKDRKIENH
jgi:hypothetical protein